MGAGGHPLELLDGCDLLCLSGGVPTTLPIVAEAARRGIALSNDTQIFMEAVPCRTLGITGSAGKTTTTTLVGRMAELSMEAPAAAYVGGNIGDPLINYVDRMGPQDLAILEISSFQLEQMDHLAEHRRDLEHHAQSPGPPRHDGSLHRRQAAHPGLPISRGYGRAGAR